VKVSEFQQPAKAAFAFGILKNPRSHPQQFDSDNRSNKAVEER